MARVLCACRWAADACDWLAISEFPSVNQSQRRTVPGASRDDNFVIRGIFFLPSPLLPPASPPPLEIMGTHLLGGVPNVYEGGVCNLGAEIAEEKRNGKWGMPK